MRSVVRPCQIPSVDEVILYTPLLDECALGVGDQAVNIWCQPQGQYLGNELGDQVYETDGPEVACFL